MGIGWSSFDILLISPDTIIFEIVLLQKHKADNSINGFVKEDLTLSVNFQ